MKRRIVLVALLVAVVLDLAGGPCADALAAGPLCAPQTASAVYCDVDHDASAPAGTSASRLLVGAQAVIARVRPGARGLAHVIPDADLLLPPATILGARIDRPPAG